ncbi:MAG: hypothetical protein AAF135_04305 [Bacteroidota bacterium]
MYLVFKDNYLHLIVDGEDLEKFHQNHEIEESVVIGHAAGDKFIFALRTNYSYEKLHVNLIANELQISLPKALAQDWVEGTIPMIERVLDVGEGRELTLKISREPMEEVNEFMEAQSE